MPLQRAMRRPASTDVAAFASASRDFLRPWRRAYVPYEGESGIVSAPDHATAPPRIAALDGIRAVAILWVIAHNVGSADEGPTGLALKLWTVVSNSGWVGVQLFFALSGFLITRILLDSKGADGWLRSFYMRRLLRIVPLYYALLAFVFLVPPHVPALAPLLAGGHRSTLWYWAYLSNWIAPFGGLAAPLPHVWSLAVEEQFYLAWPLLVAAWSDRALVRACAAMVVIALVVRLSLHFLLTGEEGSAAAYELTVARWDTIALGALVAIAIRHRRAEKFLRTHLFGIVVTLVVAVLGMTAVQRGLPARGLITELVNQPLTGLLSAAVVLACVIDTSPSSAGAWLQRATVRMLSVRWITTIGKYSYGIYIFHSPVHRVLRPYVSGWLATGTGNGRFAAHVGYSASVLGISMLLALITWNVLEQPFLSLKRYFPMRIAPRIVSAASPQASGESSDRVNG